ncbi:MAG: hypothetical protein HY897_18685 [Deltaproteobacteria bacterium]|nr:hypothetical protein [Deltaproteobacteria bacterium]
MKMVATTCSVGLALVLFAALACGCGDEDTGGGTGADGGSRADGGAAADGGGDLPNRAGGEDDIGTAVATIAVKAQAIMQASVTSSGSGVLDAAKGVSENAAAVHEAFVEAVDSSCTTIQFTEGSAKIVADFAPGCMVDEAGVKVTGHLEITVAVADEAVTVTFAFVNLAIYGYPNLTGTGTVTAGGSGVYEFAVDMTSPVEFSFSGSVKKIGDTVTVSGAGEYTKEGKTWTVAAANVTWKAGDCYPSGGTVSLKTGPVAETITFDEQTPTTGEVTITIAGKSGTMTLEPYGECP